MVGDNYLVDQVGGSLDATLEMNKPSAPPTSKYMGPFFPGAF